MKTSRYFMVLLLALGCAKAPTVESDMGIEAVHTPLTAMAGDNVRLSFKVSGDGAPLMVLQNSIGTSVIKGIQEKDKLSFTLPSEFTRKAGICKWTVIQNTNVSVSGIVEISSLEQSGQMETYLGPRSIYAGTTDYAMLVNIPTDRYDNPVIQGTPVEIKRQIRTENESYKTTTKDLISWKRLFSVERSGRMLVTSSAPGSSSKELTVDIYPAQATGFEVYFKRNHEYADGNQIIIFETSVIKDKYGNTISDGTLVTFQITNNKDLKLKTEGTSINGIAMAQMLHPDIEEQWKVEAYVTGSAKSEAILIAFQPAIQNYDLQISEDGRTILVGPILSFMAQVCPDGTPVEIKLTNENNHQLVVKTNTSVNGFTEFKLTAVQFKPGMYQLEVTIAGITKKQMLQLHEK